MQLLTTQSPSRLAKSLVFSPQIQTSNLQPANASTQRPKLRMTWHKEFDGKRERIVAYWIIEPSS